MFDHEPLVYIFGVIILILGAHIASQEIPKLRLRNRVFKAGLLRYQYYDEVREAKTTESLHAYLERHGYGDIKDMYEDEHVSPETAAFNKTMALARRPPVEEKDYSSHFSSPSILSIPITASVSSVSRGDLPLHQAGGEVRSSGDIRGGVWKEGNISGGWKDGDIGGNWKDGDSTGNWKD